MPGQMGVPGTDSPRGLRTDALGNVFYVDPSSGLGRDGRDGTDPEGPLATITKALTLVRAYSNDVIVVSHNSMWVFANISKGRYVPVQESVTITTPGIRIVGLAPSGSLGVPWIPTIAVATLLTVLAMDVLVAGLCFWDAGLGNATGILADW